MTVQCIQHLRANDYRQPHGPGGRWECFHPLARHTQNGAYMTSVTEPYAALVKLMH